MTGYENLDVKSMALVIQVYSLVKQLPKEENYALSDQIRRSAVSIPSNIAEGAARNSKKEFVQFIYIALGSLCELETQLLIATNVGYLKNIDSINKALLSIKKMLNSSISSLKRQQP